MIRNSIISKYLLQDIGEEKVRSNAEYDKLLDKVLDSQKELIAALENNDGLYRLYLNTENAVGELNAECAAIEFCEGVRLGFKLCLDIFEIDALH